MLVLRKDQHVRKRADASAHVAEHGVRHRLAGRPEIDGAHRPSSRDDRVCEADLAVQLERARLHGQRARRRPGLRRLVDDPHAHAQPRQPQGQHQARRPRADDEDVGVADRRCVLRQWKPCLPDELLTFHGTHVARACVSWLRVPATISTCNEKSPVSGDLFAFVAADSMGMRPTQAHKPNSYLCGSYRVATAPEPNSSRLTSLKSTYFDRPANNVGPWPASLGCTTNSVIINQPQLRQRQRELHASHEESLTRL